jgi:hypothetical protein
MFHFFLPGVIQYGNDEVTYSSFRYLHGSSGSVLLSTGPGCFDPNAGSLKGGGGGLLINEVDGSPSTIWPIHSICLWRHVCFAVRTFRESLLSRLWSWLIPDACPDKLRASRGLCCVELSSRMFLDYLQSPNGAEYFPSLLVPLHSVPNRIVALFSSNSTLLRGPDKCTCAGLWARIFGWKAVQNSSRLPPFVTEVIVIFISK